MKSKRKSNNVIWLLMSESMICPFIGLTGIELFKKKLVVPKNLFKLLKLKKNELINLYQIKIEYLELRNKFNLKKSNTIKNSKLFIAYYINDVRLIDNF